MNAFSPIVAHSYDATPRTLWTGRPTWRSSLQRIWKVRWIAAYFVVLLADGVRLALTRDHAGAYGWGGEAKLLAVAVVMIGGLLVMAALTARTTRYTIDTRAVTLHYGVALPATLVIPFAAIEHVGVRIHRDGSGDVALRLKRGPGVLYAKLWPHARPWRLLRPEPMLRCIPDAGVAATLLSRALQSPPDR